MATTLSEVPMPSPGDRSPELSAAERRALALSATGLVVTEIAQVMGTSAGRVRMLLASAITKLGARSKLEALVLAARSGEIDLAP